MKAEFDLWTSWEERVSMQLMLSPVREAVSNKVEAC